MRIPDTSGIYLINCLANGRIYIGSASRLRHRWDDHKSDLRKKKHGNRHLQNAYDKYGKAAFVFVVLEECPAERLLEREQYYLDTWKPFDSQGFNIAPIAGSNLGVKKSEQGRINIGNASRGRKMSPETRAKMSIAAKERAKERYKDHVYKPKYQKKTGPRTRKPASEETKAKLREANKGKQLTPEQLEKLRATMATPEYREKQSVRQKGQKRAPRSPETRAKMSASHLRRNEADSDLNLDTKP